MRAGHLLAPGALGSLFLDGRGDVAAAYALRRLASAYGGALVRVRRSSDNTEQDFGLGQPAVNWPDIAAFIGAGSGFVSRWYDQGGSGRDLAQGTASAQPAIAPVGNGVAVVFDGVDDGLKSAAFSVASPWTYHMVLRTISLPSTWFYSPHLGDRAANSAAGTRRGDGATPSTATSDVSIISGGSFLNSPLGALPVGTRGVVAGVLNGAASRLEINGPAVTSVSGVDCGSAGLDGLTVGAGASDDVHGNIEVQEAVVFSTAHSQAQAQADNAALRRAWNF
jgi:hypothetical protein